jgi:hypothetical protein
VCAYLLDAFDESGEVDRVRVGRRRRAGLRQPREAAPRDRRHRCCEIVRGEARRREPAVGWQQPPVVRSAQLGDRGRSRPQCPRRLPQPWRCSRAVRAGTGAKALVPSPGPRASIWAIAAARSSVLAAVGGTGGAYARPGRWRAAARFRFGLGRRATVVARDPVRKASSCQVAQSRRRQHDRRRPVEHDFCSLGE